MTEYANVVSKRQIKVDYVGQLIINGNTETDLMSRKDLNKWIRILFSDFSFSKPKIKSHITKSAGAEAITGFGSSYDGDIIVRINQFSNQYKIHINLFFRSMVNVDNMLLAVVEDMALTSLDWIFLNCNDGIEIVDELDDVFDNFTVTEQDI